MRTELQVQAVLLCLAGTITAQDLIKPLKTVLNSAQYSVVNPARSDVMPAGFIVASNKHATYNPLPRQLQSKFSADPFTATIYSGAATRSIGIGAVLNGIFKLANVSANFSHDNQITWDQIDVSGSKVDTDSVLTDPDVKKKVSSWINDPHKYEVYIIESTISTGNLSIISSNSTEVKAAVGADTPKCQNSSSSVPSASSTNSAQSGESASAPPSKRATTAISTQPSSSTSATTPAGSLSVCIAGTNQIKLNSATAKVIGAGLRRVSYNEGTLTAEPVTSIENMRGPGEEITVDWNPKKAKPW